MKIARFLTGLGLQIPTCFRQTNRSSSCDRLFDGVAFDPRELTETLSGDLVTRLDSIVEQGVVGEALDRAFEEWKATAPQYTLRKLKRWRRRAEQVARNISPGAALACYWAIERKLAALEADVNAAVAKYDDE